MTTRGGLSAASRPGGLQGWGSPGSGIRPPRPALGVLPCSQVPFLRLPASCLPLQSVPSPPSSSWSEAQGLVLPQPVLGPSLSAGPSLQERRGQKDSQLWGVGLGPGSRALPGFTTQVLGGGVGSLMCPWRRWGVAGACAHLLVGSGCHRPQLARPRRAWVTNPLLPSPRCQARGLPEVRGPPARLRFLAEVGVPALPSTLPTLGCSWRPPAGKARVGPASPREASGPVPWWWVESKGQSAGNQGSHPAQGVVPGPPPSPSDLPQPSCRASVLYLFPLT